VSEPRFPEVESSFVRIQSAAETGTRRRDNVPPHYARTSFGPSTLSPNRVSRQEGFLAVSEYGIERLELSNCVAVSGSDTALSQKTALTAHAGSRTKWLERRDVVVTAVPTVSVCVMYPARHESSRRGRHAQHREGQPSVDAVRQRPTHNASRVQIQKDCQGRDPCRRTRTASFCVRRPSRLRRASFVFAP
jgi:hypothetical protein